MNDGGNILYENFAVIDGQQSVESTFCCGIFGYEWFAVKERVKEKDNF